MTAEERAVWALSSGSTSLIGSIFSLADADAFKYIQQAVVALCGHDVNSEGERNLKLSSVLSEASLILGIPSILEAKEFSHEKV
jgi:hypothetical protein